MAGKLELIGTFHLSNSVSDEVAYLYRATRAHRRSQQCPEGPRSCTPGG